MNEKTIKTGVEYTHKRTGEIYLARHIGLLKVGHDAPRKGWVECVMYQKANKPSEWFARDLATFNEQFRETREVLIELHCQQLDIEYESAPRAVAESWSIIFQNGAHRLSCDVVSHSHGARHVGQDKVTGPIQASMAASGFVIADGTVFELVGEEVTLG